MKVIPINPEQPKSNDPLDTVCDFKWTYPIFQIDRGDFRSCCRTPSYPVEEHTLQEKGIDAFLNNDFLIRSRLDLINGVKHNDCNTCWKLEEKGMKSPREATNFFYYMRREGLIPRDTEFSEDAIREGLKQVTDLNHPFLKSKHPFMLELSLGNTCDMKCMYCNHHYSTQWATELIKSGEISQEQYDREFPSAAPSYEKTFWEWFDKVGRATTHRINIIGGEPLIMPKFYEYVERMAKKMKGFPGYNRPREQKPILCIVTNLNTPPNYFNRFMNNMPEILETFDIDILISAESVGKRAEYIRNGVDWERFNSNVHALLSRKDLKFNVGFLMSVNLLSIATTKEFIQYATELSRQYSRPISLKQNIVNFPSWQNPLVLPKEFANYVDDAIAYMEANIDSVIEPDDFHGRYDQYILFLKKLSESMRNNTGDYTGDRRHLYHWYRGFDIKRDLNFLETFPEYADFYEQCRLLNG